MPPRTFAYIRKSGPFYWMGDSPCFPCLWTSSLGQYEEYVRVLWLAMLGMARAGLILASIPILSRAANIEPVKAEHAIELFLAPDPYSRNPDNEGRRIEVIYGGWRILNHDIYVKIARDIDRRAYKTEWERNKRAKAGSSNSLQARGDYPQLSTAVHSCPPSFPPSFPSSSPSSPPSFSPPLYPPSISPLSAPPSSPQSSSQPPKTVWTGVDKLPGIVGDDGTPPLILESEIDHRFNDPFGNPVPLRFRTDAFMNALHEWYAYKRERKETYKPIGAKAFLTKLEALGSPERAIQAIEHSMACNWAGVFEPREQIKAGHGHHGNGKVPVSLEIRLLEEAISKHKANPKSPCYDRSCPDGLRQEFAQLKTKLANLKRTVTHG